MSHALGPLAALLMASAILLTGNGLQSTLIAVRANLEGFPVLVIGGLMSAYFTGFVAGCFCNPAIVQRSGHIRAFAAFAALACAAALLHALIVHPLAWLILRVVVGFCFSGLAMVIESWINERATNQNRGTLFAVYRSVDLTAHTLGQLLLITADPSGMHLFLFVAIMVSLALVPVALTTTTAPRPIEARPFRVTKVFETSPLAAWAVLATGLSNGAFWGLAPNFVQNQGYDIGMVAYFMAAVIMGGAIFQVPLGYLSDRTDRRLVLILIAFCGGSASLFLAYCSAFGPMSLFFAGVFFGAFAMSIYSMSVAHANDFADRADFVEISSGLLFLFGIGAIAGPLFAAGFVALAGDAALFVYMAGAQWLLVIYGIYRVRIRPSVPVHQQATFQPASAAPRATPESAELDPRSLPHVSNTPCTPQPTGAPNTNSS